MKGKAIFCSSILLASILLVPKSVEAEEPSSNGILTIVQGRGVTSPVHPNDPSTPVIPIDSTGSEIGTQGTPASLTIDFVSNFDFGTQQIQSTTKEYYAKSQSFEEHEDGPNYVQVTDTRGVGSGWVLSVKQVNQFQTLVGGESIDLEGASLSFENGNVKSLVSELYAPEIHETLTLTPGVEADLTIAPHGKGMGTWLSRFGKDESDKNKAVKLTVPGNAVKLKKEYRTKLVWSIKNVPTSGVPN